MTCDEARPLFMSDPFRLAAAERFACVLHMGRCRACMDYFQSAYAEAEARAREVYGEEICRAVRALARAEAEEKCGEDLKDPEIREMIVDAGRKMKSD